MEKLFIFAIVLVVLCVATIVSLVLRHLTLKKKHTMSMPATVISTRTEQQRRNDLEETYYATFELFNHEKKELELPEHIRQKVKIGKIGMITFTSKHLLHFKEGEHSKHIFTHYRKMNQAL